MADPLFLNLDTRRILLISFTLWPFYPRETNLRRPLNRKLGRIQCLSGHYGEDKKLITVAGAETRLQFCPAGVLVSVPSEISGFPANKLFHT